MKRFVFIICTLLSVQTMSAQIITSKSAVTQKIEKPSYPLEKGYRGFVEGSISIVLLPVQITTTHGYQINDYVYVGGGLGLMIDCRHMHHTFKSPNVSIPIYATSRFYCTKTKVKPFIDVKLGYVIPLHWTTSNCEYHHYKYRSNGFYGLLGAGIEYKHFNVSINWNPISEEVINYNEDWENAERSKEIKCALGTLCLAYNF